MVASKESIDWLLRRPEEMRIALDLDGVVADPFTHMVELWNQQRGTNHTINDVSTFGVEFAEVGMTSKDFYGLYNKVWLELQHRILLLADPKLLSDFSQCYTVDIVTHRPENMLKATLSFISSNYPGFRGNIVIVNSAEEKVRRGYGLFIDDNPLLHLHIEEFGAKGEEKPHQILIDGPWNRKYQADQPSNVRTMKETNDALNFLISESKRRERVPLKSI